MRDKPRARLVGYSVAMLAPAASLFIRWPLWPWLGNAVPHMTFFPAVMIAGYVGGFWPGLLATLLSAVAANYFLTGQLRSLQFTGANDIAALILFLVVGIIMSALCESLHRARRRHVALERQRAEDALHATKEQHWQSLTETLPQLVWSAGPDGTCDYFSAQWTAHTGVAENGLLGWRWLETLHPDDREPTRTFWLESVAGRHPYDVEYRVRRKDGVYRWFKTRGVPIRDPGGNIVKWFGSCTDITDLRQTEEALRQSEKRFRGTFENAAVGIVHTDPTGRFLRVNEKFCSIVGYPREVLLEKSYQDITHPDDLDASMRPFIALMLGESTVFELEKRYIRQDGSPVWVELFASLQRDAEGKPAYAIVMIQDISDRKRLDAELRRAKEAAEAANRAKDEFLANVSHEIRTPMNAILGMTELTLDTPLTEHQRQCLKTAKSAADSLLGIINDLLDFAKIEAGKTELSPADFSLRCAVGDTLRSLAARAHKKELELIYHLQPDVPDDLVGDSGRLRQVLLNLVGNAIKFTDRGEIVVHVEIDGAPRPQEVNLRFTVEDTGIGIPQDQQARIFQAFEQEDTSTTRKYGGTGLGLTISARLVSLMGGKITVDSEPGRGSTFSFTASFGRQLNAAEGRCIQPPVALHNLPVLVVDDNATNRRILEEWLHSWRMRPQTAADGTAAMEALGAAAASGPPFELVLLDARMPDVNALALATKIRERVELSGTRIILLTSGDRAADVPRFRELGVHAYLLKPVQEEQLLDAIHQVMSGSNGMAAPAPAPPCEPERISVPAPAGQPLRVLVAEDNEFNSQLIEELLGRRGHTVRLVDNGRDALRLAEGQAFDVLLLDVHMPELDGFEVARGIREHERTTGEHLPIVALTARSRKEDREQCIAVGMDDFLAKPINAADLWAAMERALGMRSDHQKQDLLDARVLLAACGDDGTILKRICQTLQVRLPDHMNAVEAAFEAADASRLREAAHKLAGMIGAFSTVAGRLASEVEDHASEGQIQEVKPLVKTLEAMTRDLMQVVAGLSLETLRKQASTAIDASRAAGEGRPA
jgi:PAS domain S-box-containing protein